MAVNPNLLVTVNDGGCPRTFTGIAGSDISGGQFVHLLGATPSVTSGLSSFVSTDLIVLPGASGLAFNGIALQTATSGNPIAVATRGFYIVSVAGTVLAGYPVSCTGGDAVEPWSAEGGVSGGMIHGRALTAAGSEQYCIVSIFNC